MNRPEPPVSPLTPCVGVCRLDAAGYCIGCRRSLDEIAGWTGLEDDERARLMREVLPRRGGPVS